MIPHKFADGDKEKVIKFLKLIKETGKFTHDAAQAVEFVSSWMWIEQTLLKKIDANVLEVKSVTEGPAPEPAPATKKKVTRSKAKK